jgi:hypothetical protein
MFNALESAFRMTFIDLCSKGYCRFDEVVLDRLWQQFQTDLAEGFPSLFDDYEDES